MSTSLDNIWDEPPLPLPSSPNRRLNVVASDNESSASRPSKRPRSSLFLPSDDEDDAAREWDSDHVPRPPPKSEIDELFADIDGDISFTPLAPELDLTSLRRQADEKHRNALALEYPTTAPSSSPRRNSGTNGMGSKGKGKRKDADGSEKKERKKIARLDEARLLSPDGFPALMRETKNFRPKGKGHEATDLSRLLTIYQFWTHKLHPKMKFNDTVERVEKLCHSKRMHVALSVWRDESRGITTNKNAEENDTIDLTSDFEKDNSTVAGPHIGNGTDRNDRSLSVPPSIPPSSASEPVDGDDDFDIDAIIRQEIEKRARAAQAIASASDEITPVPPGDDAIWDALNELEEPASGYSKGLLNPPAQTLSRSVDDDEEMWDIVLELEKQNSSNVQPADNHVQGGPSTQNVQSSLNNQIPVPQSRPTNDTDWDDMYL